MSLSTQLRAATNGTHSEIETLPLSRAMAEGTVDRDEYVHFLQHLLAIHEGWEPLVATSPVCATVWSNDMRRTSAIARDLVALGADATPVLHPAVVAWLAAVQTEAEVRPEVWLGVLYLFEGSRMGSLALARPLSRALGVAAAPGHGLDYHLDGAAGRGPRWAQFKAALDALPLTHEQQDAATWGAVATFEMLFDVYAATPVPTYE